MAKVYGPLFSIEASGRLDNSLVFKKTRFGNVVGKFPKPVTTPATALQTTIREYFQLGSTAWKNANSTVKEAWNSYASTLSTGASGYNIFVGTYVKYLKDHAGTEPTSITTPPAMA